MAELATAVGDHAEKNGLGKLKVMALPETRLPPADVVNTTVAATPVFVTTDDPAAIEIVAPVTILPIDGAVKVGDGFPSIVVRIVNVVCCATAVLPIATPVSVIPVAAFAANVPVAIVKTPEAVDQEVVNVTPALVIDGVVAAKYPDGNVTVTASVAAR